MYLGQAAWHADPKTIRSTGAGAVCAFPAKAGTRTIGVKTVYEELARTSSTAPSDFLFLGRGIHFPIALEGALKLKEISYIHAEGYPAGEMKHGPNALIDENLPVVVLATRDPDSEESRMRYEKTLSNIQEVKARERHCHGDRLRGRREEVRKTADHRDLDSRVAANCCCPCWRSFRCSCWPITSRCASDATWISPEISRRA